MRAAASGSSAVESFDNEAGRSRPGDLTDSQLDDARHADGRHPLRLYTKQQLVDHLRGLGKPAAAVLLQAVHEDDVDAVNPDLLLDVDPGLADLLAACPELLNTAGTALAQRSGPSGGGADAAVMATGGAAAAAAAAAARGQEALPAHLRLRLYLVKAFAARPMLAHANSAARMLFEARSDRQLQLVIESQVQQDAMLGMLLQELLDEMLTTPVTPAEPMNFLDSMFQSVGGGGGGELRLRSLTHFVNTSNPKVFPFIPVTLRGCAYLKSNGDVVPCALVEFAPDSNQGAFLQHLQRDYTMMGRMSAIVTLFDLKGHVLHQNAGSIAYYGYRRHANTGGHAVRRAKRCCGLKAGNPAAPTIASLEASIAAARGSEVPNEPPVLNQLFSLAPTDVLDAMLESMLQGSVWKSIVPVPYSLSPAARSVAEGMSNPARPRLARGCSFTSDMQQQPADSIFTADVNALYTAANISLGGARAPGVPSGSHLNSRADGFEGSFALGTGTGSPFQTVFAGGVARSGASFMRVMGATRLGAVQEQSQEIERISLARVEGVGPARPPLLAAPERPLVVATAASGAEEASKASADPKQVAVITPGRQAASGRAVAPFAAAASPRPSYDLRAMGSSAGRRPPSIGSSLRRSATAALLSMVVPMPPEEPPAASAPSAMGGARAASGSRQGITNMLARLRRRSVVMGADAQSPQEALCQSTWGLMGTNEARVNDCSTGNSSQIVSRSPPSSRGYLAALARPVSGQPSPIATAAVGSLTGRAAVVFTDQGSTPTSQAQSQTSQSQVSQSQQLHWQVTTQSQSQSQSQSQQGAATASSLSPAPSGRQSHGGAAHARGLPFSPAPPQTSPPQTSPGASPLPCPASLPAGQLRRLLEERIASDHGVSGDSHAAGPGASPPPALVPFSVSRQSPQEPSPADDAVGRVVVAGAGVAVCQSLSASSHVSPKASAAQHAPEAWAIATTNHLSTHATGMTAATAGSQHSCAAADGAAATTAAAPPLSQLSCPSLPSVQLPSPVASGVGPSAMQQALELAAGSSGGAMAEGALRRPVHPFTARIHGATANRLSLDTVSTRFGNAAGGGSVGRRPPARAPDRSLSSLVAAANLQHASSFSFGPRAAVNRPIVRMMSFLSPAPATQPQVMMTQGSSLAQGNSSPRNLPKQGSSGQLALSTGTGAMDGGPVSTMEGGFMAGGSPARGLHSPTTSAAANAVNSGSRRAPRRQKTFATSQGSGGQLAVMMSTQEPLAGYHQEPTSSAAYDGGGPGPIIPGGWPAGQRLFHEVTATSFLDPVSRSQVVMVVQQDVTARVRLERRLAEVMEAEHKLLENIFPRHVLEHIAGASAAATSANASQFNLQMLSVMPDARSTATDHEQVTILFADIVGFTTMCKEVPAKEVMTFLNNLYTRFDQLLDIYGVYKVETIGDCYMVAGGLISKDADGCATVRTDSSDKLQAWRVLSFAKAMLRDAQKVVLPTTREPVKMRVGIHTGPAVSGVVGMRMPRFCLFGDTVNTASRMESTCPYGRIQVSDATHALIQKTGDADDWEPTGGVQVKGKGIMQTFLWRPPLLPELPPALAAGSMSVCVGPGVPAPRASSRGLRHASGAGLATDSGRSSRNPSTSQLRRSLNLPVTASLSTGSLPNLKLQAAALEGLRFGFGGLGGDGRNRSLADLSSAPGGTSEEAGGGRAAGDLGQSSTGAASGSTGDGAGTPPPSEPVSGRRNGASRLAAFTATSEAAETGGDREEAPVGSDRDDSGSAAADGFGSRIAPGSFGVGSSRGA